MLTLDHDYKATLWLQDTPEGADDILLDLMMLRLRAAYTSMSEHVSWGPHWKHLPSSREHVLDHSRQVILAAQQVYNVLVNM